MAVINKENMQYRKGSNGEELSSLGFGCMRFQKKGSAIDIDEAEKEVMTAIDNGINYFDTAYIYSGSEVALGEIIRRNNCRDKMYIATKLPLFLVHSRENMDKYFNEHLERLGTDHIDYYLMHMLSDVTQWERLKAIGIEDWIAGKLANGQIKHIGFSNHGSTAAFKELVDAYNWDFCQIQYNYMDETSQAGVEGLKYAVAKGLHVVIMEPLRGGRLVNLLPESAKKLIAEEGNGMTAAEIAFRWLYNQPEVTTVLSGMNSMDMLLENIRIAKDATPGHLNSHEINLINKIKAEINSKIKVGCTGCAYCMPCPRGVDIPGTFKCFNTIYTENKKSAIRDYRQTTILKKVHTSASQCIECGKCEQHCPQHIEIRKELKNAVKELETPSYKLVKKFVKIFKIF